MADKPNQELFFSMEADAPQFYKIAPCLLSINEQIDLTNPNDFWFTLAHEETVVKPSIPSIPQTQQDADLAVKKKAGNKKQILKRNLSPLNNLKAKKVLKNAKPIIKEEETKQTKKIRPDLSKESSTNSSTVGDFKNQKRKNKAIHGIKSTSLLSFNSKQRQKGQEINQKKVINDPQKKPVPLNPRPKVQFIKSRDVKSVEPKKISTHVSLRSLHKTSVQPFNKEKDCKVKKNAVTKWL